MKLYHGSKEQLKSIEKRQAGKAEHIEVPENELLNAIYVTPDYGFALACAARPEGVSHINDIDKSIIFENPELFNPELDVYIYEVDAENIPPEQLKQVNEGDELQYAILNTNEVLFSNQFSHKARDIEKYYKLENWKEKPVDPNFGFKMK